LSPFRPQRFCSLLFSLAVLPYYSLAIAAAFCNSSFMRIHVLQHVPFEGIGSIAAWAEARQAMIQYTRFFEDFNLPALDSIDMIIVMGGPMSVNDENKYPWLVQEKSFLRDAVARGIPVLGICLGAQLIASALGARVYQNAVKEIGWFPVRAVSATDGNLHLPQECLAFHWHGETFDLPAGAVHLAESDVCRNQAFQLNRNVIGFQFHLETTPESASALLENCRDEILPGPYIQSEKELRSVPLSSYQTINALMNDVLAYLTE
jgi:GMP synthase-like glutamine amidotransferase